MPGSSTGQPLARDMAVSVLTSLLTLPTELLQEIIQYLDNLSLIEFALTCKGVHCIALEHFFSREKVLIPSPDGNWCSTPLNSPVGVMKALRVSLFLNSFSTLQYCFARDIGRFLEDVTDMRRLLERQSYIHGLYLCFPFLRAYSFTRIDRMHWRQALTRALDAAIQRSCQDIVVSGTDQLNYLYEEPRDVDPTHRIRTTRSMQLKKVTLPPKYPNKLVSVCMFNAMLLRPTFFDWTTSTLHNASSTLKTLEIMCQKSISAEYWQCLFEGLALPELTTFKIDQTMYETPPVGVSILRDFLLRHTHITSLELHGVGCPDAKLMPLHDTPLFPRLVALSAHPSWVSALLSKMLASGSFITAENAIIDLKSVVLSTNSHFAGVPDFDSFNTAIQQIAMFPPGSDITFSLLFMHNRNRDDGVADWITEHITLGPADSVLGQLKSVSRFNLLSKHMYLFTPDIIDLMPSFVGLFPHVQSVAFEFNENKDAILNSSYLGRMADACPTLNIVKAGSTSVDLTETRHNRS